MKPVKQVFCNVFARKSIRLNVLTKESPVRRSGWVHWGGARGGGRGGGGGGGVCGRGNGGRAGRSRRGARIINPVLQSAGRPEIE